jgi:hypothetical protein
MKLRPNPETIKGQIFPSIYDHTFPLFACFSDLSVAIGIYSLACLYNLKANRNQFSKYFEVYMILKDDCTERPLLAIEVWSAEVETCNLRLFHPLLGYQFSVGHVISPGQGLSSTRGKSLGGWYFVWARFEDSCYILLSFMTKPRKIKWKEYWRKKLFIQFTWLELFPWLKYN